jgi:hypothetical protein
MSHLAVALLHAPLRSRTRSQEAETKKLHEKLNKLSVELLNRLLDCLELPRGAGEEGLKVWPLLTT